MRYTLTLILLLLAGRVDAAITEVASSQRIGKAVSTLSDSTTQVFPANVTAGDMIVIVGVADTTPTSFLITDNRSTSYTVQSYASGTYRVYVAWGIAGSTASYTISVNPAPNNARIYFNMDVWTGQHGTPLDISLTAAEGTSTTPSVTVTPSVNGTLVYAFMTQTSNTTVTITPDAAFTEIKELETGFLPMTGSSQYKLVTTNAPVTATWTLGSSQPWIAFALTFKAADSTTPTVGGGGQVGRKRIFVTQ